MTFNHRIIGWLLLALVAGGLLPMACKRVPTGAGVAYAGEPAAGLIALSTTGRGTGLPAIEQNAVRAALETLLFVGVPASGSNRLPLTDFNSVPTTFLDRFVQQGLYQPFISGLDRSDERRRRAAGGGKTIRYTLTINQEALRRHLEQQGLIRPLGY